MKRTNNCGELNIKFEGQNATLAGWVDARRDHGGVIFIDLRDRYGITQIVFEPTHKKEVHEKAQDLRREFVIMSKGTVRPRKEGMINPRMKTGEIEILADELIIVSESETPPIEIDDRKVANEDIRLKYRYLDLRRPQMQSNLILRHKIVTAARNYANNHGFLEIETPLLLKSTPEGARDYVVPSRVHPGKFYALPQSPQLYKQLLMISGFDRYYQVARCLRDEDLRADRQPEHTQFDLEVSFTDQKEIQSIVEGLIKNIFKETLQKELEKFPVISYKESMDKYGTDKPDIRFGLEITDVTDVVKKSDFGVFKSVAETGGKVKCLNPPSDLPRKEIDRYIEFCQSIGSKGMAWMRVTETGLDSNIAKFFNPDVQKELIELVGAKPGSIVMFLADKPKKAAQLAGQLRLKLGQDMKMIKEEEFKFLFVNDFPLFAYNEDTQTYEPEHHMFSMPKKEYINDFENRPGEVLGDLWDLVLNGVEMASGSIRVSDPKLQARIMDFVGIKFEEAHEKFGFLLDAYKYGAPVHGGMGIGIDRLTAMMLGTNDIREVIAFPKNKSAECPMDGSPSNIDDKQMKELHLKTDVVKKKENTVFEDIKNLLQQNKIQFEVLEHEAVFTSEQSAKARGTELKQGAKALILKTEKGYIQAVISAAKEIDIAKLKTIIGAKELKMATADQVKTETGCDIGSVPPFGNLFGLPTYIDNSLMENKTIAFNAGSHIKSIKMTSEDLAKTTKAKIDSFAK